MKTKQLSAKGVEKIIRTKQWRWHCDGAGLYLVGSPQYETFRWVLRMYRSTATGKPRDIGLGSAKVFTLADARKRADELRQQAARGIDPIEERRIKKDAERADALSRITFRDATKEFLDLHAPTWKNAKHRAQWGSSLEMYAYRMLGSVPVREIDGAAITDALLPIWTTKQETASRVKQRIERIVQWVKDGKPLPMHGASKRVEHHKTLPFAELPAFMAELRDLRHRGAESSSISARALEFLILTAARTGEVIGARWDEIENGVWVIPAERMKAGRQHRVPLSKRALAILDALPREGEYIFPGAREGKPLSNMAMLQLLRGMSGNGYTVHGFRSAFSDWARETTAYPRDVVEMALAHAIKDKSEAAYRRGDALEKRRKLMQAWTDYCAAPITDSKVLPMRKKRA